MTFAAWNPFVTQFVPHDFARVLFQGQHPPLMRVLVVRRSDVAVKPHLYILVAGASRGDDINNISPNDGRRMRQPGNGRVPADVFAFLNIPLDWRSRAR